MTTLPLEKTELKARLYDPYKVLLHNDPHNEFDHVVASVGKSVPQLDKQKTQDITMEAHTAGTAVVITCPLEHAELYADRLKSFGLTSSIEKDF